MKTPWFASLPLFLGSCLLAGVHAAEIGDLDGDGRITIADLPIYSGLFPAPGSFEGFTEHPCAAGSPNWYWKGTVPLMIYLESLSRGVEGSLPPWYGMWTEKKSAPPLPADPRVRVDLGSSVAQGGDSDLAEFGIWFSADVPVNAFSLVFESEGGVLRAPRLTSTHWGRDSYKHVSAVGDSSPWKQNLLGQFPVGVALPASLATGGKFVVNLGISSLPIAPISPGDTEIAVAGRLPLGTAPGAYWLRLASGSEVLLADGTVVAPTAVNEGEIRVSEEVTTGWDEGPPPLRFDMASRSVLGPVEFRVTDSEGRTPVEGQPLVEVMRGEEFLLRIQMRTEVPLNNLLYHLAWPSGTLECAGSDGLANDGGFLLQNPEDGRFYEPFRGNGVGCSSAAVPWPPPSLRGWYFLAASNAFGPDCTYPDRLLEYFKPLGEWVDVQEFRLRVSEAAPAGDVPLALQPSSMTVEFIPYNAKYPCGDNPQDWNYDLRLHDAFVRVLADTPPPPPPVGPDVGIAVDVSDAAGKPGDLLEIPVLARADTGLSMLSLAIEVDTELVDVEGLAVDVLSLLTGDMVRLEATRGESAMLKECVEQGGQEVCSGGVPWATVFVETDPKVTYLNILPSNVAVLDYPGPTLREVLRLLVRIREDAKGLEAFLRPGKVSYQDGSIAVQVEPGGTLAMPEGIVFSPASSTRAGRIAITGRDFLRGDANNDGNVSLSDAVWTLSFLFMGGKKPPCMDAADSDDSGKVEITDPIRTLGMLFLGQEALPPPYPACGTDAAADDLGCAESSCP